MEQIYIKDVALYLRKSRGEEDKDLEKHRIVLTEIAKSNNWRYVCYEEIGNSESIEGRPKFSKLLKEIEEELWDAVLVIDYDRLGRGEGGDQDKIRETFKYSKTYVITPDRVYNLNNESDEDYTKFKGFFANFEYTQIKRRLNRGKKIGAKLGHWTNGIPPFPYLYAPERKGLIVNEEYRETYNEMKRTFFDGVVFKKIAWHLNNKNIPSPRGSVWHENAVRRILIDETHLGRIISGKTKGSGHKTKNGMRLTEKQLKKNTLINLPRSEWTIVENCHEALKTQEEHDEILQLLKQRKKIPDVVTKGVYLLSGLIFCSKCKRSILIQNRKGRYSVTKGCQYHDPFGNKCVNGSVRLEFLEDAALKELDVYAERLYTSSGTSTIIEDRIVKQIRAKELEIEKSKASITRIQEMYEDGDYSKDVYLTRVNARKEKLGKLEQDLQELNWNLSQVSQTTNKDRLEKITTFKELLNNTNDIKFLNNELRKIVQRIEYKREAENLNLSSVEIIVEIIFY